MMDNQKLIAEANDLLEGKGFFIVTADTEVYVGDIKKIEFEKETTMIDLYPQNQYLLEPDGSWQKSRSPELWGFDSSKDMGLFNKNSDGTYDMELVDIGSITMYPVKNQFIDALRKKFSDVVFGKIPHDLVKYSPT
jgi:hypothetical protein